MSTLQKHSPEAMNYGQGNAIMVLVAEKMGLQPALVDMAKKVLSGGVVHVMVHAAIEREAVAANNQLRTDPVLIAKANGLCAEIKQEYELGT